MNAAPEPADIAAMRKDGDLEAFLLSLTGRAPTKAKPADEKHDDAAPYHIPRPGAWPCGTAPSGPTPPPCGACPPTA